MKPFIMLVLCLNYFTMSTAQSFKYEMIEGKNTTLSDDLIKTSDGYLHFEADANKKIMLTPFGNLNKIKYGITINKLDEGMKEILSKDLFDGEKRLVPWLYRVFEFNNKAYLLYHDIVSEEQSGLLKLMEIDKQTAEKKSEKTIIDFELKKIVFDSKSVIKYRFSTYNFYMSESKKRILITSEPMYAKDSRKVLYAWIYDEDFKLVAEKTIDFKTVNENINVYSTICDDSGNIYIAYREFYGVDKKGNILGKDGEKVIAEVQDDMKKLLIVRPNSSQETISLFNLPEHSVFKMGLLYSPLQKKVFLLGTFCKAWDGNILGVFQASVDISSMKQSPIKLTNFPKEFIEKISDDGFAKTKVKKYGLLRDFRSNYVIRANGSVDVLMHYMEETTSQSIVNGVPKNSYTHYTGGDFVDAHLDNDSFSFTRIGQEITSTGTNAYLFSSTFSTGDNLMLLYNDNEKNIKREIALSPLKGVVQSSEICVATIDKSGNVTRQRLLPGMEGKSIGILTNILILDQRTFLVLVQHLNFMNMSTKNTKFARVKIE